MSLLNIILKAEESTSLIVESTESVTEEITSTVGDTASEIAKMFTKEWWTNVSADVVSWCLSTGLKLLIALVILFISFKVINLICKRLYRRFQKKNYDETLSRVSTNILRISLKAIVAVCLIGWIGIETSAIASLIATLGVGISLAVQGTLSNFAGGVIIVIMRPIKIGDFITSNGQSGTVEDIKLFYTQLATPDNKVVYIPNGSLANNVIVNASVKDTRRVDVVFSVSYDTNLELAKNLARKVCENNSLIFKDPMPFVNVGEYADSSINLYIRVWVNRPDYWTVYYYLLNELKNTYDEYHIEIPFNQLDVTIKNNNN